MDRKTGAVRKTIVRNIEVPQKTTQSRRSIASNFAGTTVGVCDHGKKPVRNDAKTTETPAPSLTTCRLNKENMFEHGIKYKVPQTNTSDKIKEKIDRVYDTKASKTVKMQEMTPRSKAVVTHEVTRKLNFPPDKPIFKNLIPINVNDSLLISTEQRRPIRKKYVAKTNKDPVPELADFLTPIPPLKHILPVKDKPPIKLKSDNDFYKSVYELHVNFHPDC